MNLFYYESIFEIKKIKKGSNSINTDDMVIIFAFCASADGPSINASSFI